MKHFTIVCLAAVAVASLQRPAEAGRRTRRAVRTAVVAAAVVTAAPRRTTVVAAAPVVVAAAPVVVAAAPIVVARPRPGVVALPDLTITGLVAEHDALLITVTNIGRAPSPLTRLDVTLRRQSSGLVLGAQASRVLPLAVGQSVRIRLRAVPLDDVHFACVVDPLAEVAEISEFNNTRALALAARPVPPPMLQDEAQWQQPASAPEVLPPAPAE